VNGEHSAARFRLARYHPIVGSRLRGTGTRAATGVTACSGRVGGTSLRGAVGTWSGAGSGRSRARDGDEKRVQSNRFVQHLGGSGVRGLGTALQGDRS
jgi:hypothetical protein